MLKVRKSPCTIHNLTRQAVDGNQQVVLLMSRYRKCTRIYWRNTQKVPSSWGDAAYQMLKVCRPCNKLFMKCLIAYITTGQDRTPLVEPYTNCNRNVPSNDGNMLAVGQNQGSNAGKTIIRVRVEHGIQVSLNSLVTPAVASLVQDTVMNVSQLFPGWYIMSQAVPASESRVVSRCCDPRVYLLLFG